MRKGNGWVAGWLARGAFVLRRRSAAGTRSMLPLVVLLVLVSSMSLAADAASGFLASSYQPAPIPRAFSPSARATLTLHRVSLAPGTQGTVLLMLDTVGSPVYSADVVVSYDPAVVTAVGVARGGLVSGWSLASNLDTPGVVRIALAGAEPATDVGVLIMITFQTVGAEGATTDLTLIRGDLNEGGVPAILQNGRLVVRSSPCYDYVDPPAVGVTDVQTVAGLWRQPISRPYDVDGDGAVTVVDIMRVAAAWGDTCQ